MDDLLVRLYEFRDDLIKLIETPLVKEGDIIIDLLEIINLLGKKEMLEMIITLIENELSER